CSRNSAAGPSHVVRLFLEGVFSPSVLLSGNRRNLQPVCDRSDDPPAEVDVELMLATGEKLLKSGSGVLLLNVALCVPLRLVIVRVGLQKLLEAVLNIRLEFFIGNYLRRLLFQVLCHLNPALGIIHGLAPIFGFGCRKYCTPAPTASMRSSLGTCG